MFRIGGDEFAALLTGADYESRAELAEAFNRMTEANLHGEGAVVAMGMSVFRPEEDESIQQVFERADKRMYERKRQLKEM